VPAFLLIQQPLLAPFSAFPPAEETRVITRILFKQSPSSLVTLTPLQ
jgi:hypothetical protein